MKLILFTYIVALANMVIAVCRDISQAPLFTFILCLFSITIINQEKTK